MEEMWLHVLPDPASIRQMEQESSGLTERSYCYWLETCSPESVSNCLVRAATTMSFSTMYAISSCRLSLSKVIRASEQASQT